MSSRELCVTGAWTAFPNLWWRLAMPTRSQSHDQVDNRVMKLDVQCYSGRTRTPQVQDHGAGLAAKRLTCRLRPPWRPRR